MAKSLEEIRKKLQELDAFKGGSGSFGGDKTTYAHWNIPEGTTAKLRCLPDGNEDNSFFWVERQIIKLQFPGIKGQDENKQVVVQVPCIEMWDGKNKCPILNEVRPWWKDKSMEDTARKYWIKRTFYAQGFVKQDPMNETEIPENPIRKFIIGPQIYAIMKAALLDPEMINSPVNFINGTDFLVSKTSKGGYADYGTSKWARNESSLTDDQQAAIAQYGLVDLSTYLPKRPTPEQLSIMFDMFEASVAGELYDPARWSQHYKPFGFDSSTNVEESGGEGVSVRRAPVRPAQVTVSKTAVEEDDVASAEASFARTVTEEPVTAPSTVNANAGKTPQEILAMIRNRNK